jgi:hypothetical protein
MPAPQLPQFEYLNLNPVFSAAISALRTEYSAQCAAGASLGTTTTALDAVVATQIAIMADDSLNYSPRRDKFHDGILAKLQAERDFLLGKYPMQVGLS